MEYTHVITIVRYAALTSRWYIPGKKATKLQSKTPSRDLKIRRRNEISGNHNESSGKKSSWPLICQVIGQRRYWFLSTLTQEMLLPYVVTFASPHRHCAKISPARFLSQADGSRRQKTNPLLPTCSWPCPPLGILTWEKKGGEVASGCRFVIVFKEKKKGAKNQGPKIMNNRGKTPAPSYASPAAKVSLWGDAHAKQKQRHRERVILPSSLTPPYAEQKQKKPSPTQVIHFPRKESVTVIWKKENQSVVTTVMLWWWWW